MSPLPPNDWQVLLAPDGLHAARLAWRWRGMPRRILEQARHDGAGSWAGALDELEAMLRTQARPGRLQVILSNRLVRYALVPWQPGLGGAAAQAYQRDCFARLYGDAALEWHIAATPPRRRAPGLASAVDTALVVGLQALCKRSGARLASLQPQLAAVVNRWRRALRAECFWLVLAEPGYLCLALARQRAWHAVSSARPAGDTLAALAPLLEREALLADPEAAPTHVYLWAPSLDTTGMDAIGGLPVVHLGTGAAHPLAALSTCGGA